MGSMFVKLANQGKKKLSITKSSTFMGLSGGPLFY